MRFEAYREKVHGKVAKPTTITTMGEEDPKAIAEVLATAPEEFQHYHYSWVFDGNFEEGAYYLPYALEDLAAMKEGYREYATTVVRHINSYQENLRTLGVLEDTITNMVIVFDTWLHTFQPTPPRILEHVPKDLRFAAVVRDGDTRDEYLDAMYSAWQVWFTPAHPATHILSEWSGTVDMPARSAHLLDTCAKAAGGQKPLRGASEIARSKDGQRLVTQRPEWKPILEAAVELEKLQSRFEYQGPNLANRTSLRESADMRRLLTQHDLLAQHFRCAKKAWDRLRIPVWYVKATAGFLGLP